MKASYILQETVKRILFLLIGLAVLLGAVALVVLAAYLIVIIGHVANVYVFHVSYIDPGAECLFGILILGMLTSAYSIGKLIYTERLKK